MPLPYVIYADFEGIIKPKTAKAGDKSEITSEHEACGFGHQVVRYNGQVEEPVIYRGTYTVEVFLNHLDCGVNNINMFAHLKPVSNNKYHENATQCWICGQERSNNNNHLKVKDNCHFTGEYRGAAHKYCNLKFKVKPGKTKIPVIFQYLKGNGSQLIMQKKHCQRKHQLHCHKFRKYISFGIGQLSF